MGIYTYIGIICKYMRECSYGYDCLYIDAYIGIYYIGISFMPYSHFAYIGINVYIGMNAYIGIYVHVCP